MKSTSTSLSTKSAGAGVLAAIVASLCCIIPVLAFTAGISGIAATFSWIEPFRPYLVGLTISVLGFAWYQKLRPKTAEEIECACEPARPGGGEDEKHSFWQSKRFLGIVTMFAALMLTFPSYSKAFYPDLKNSGIAKGNSMQLANFRIEGMTCTGCEEHVKHATTVLTGVVSSEASYIDESARIVFNASLIDLDMIVTAINETGYTVVSSEVQPFEIVNPEFSNEDVSFYSVPLVCNAATTIGCGSRSRPVLKTLEENESVLNAWLDRSGKYIAVEWQPNTAQGKRNEMIATVIDTHSINIKQVSGDEALELSVSFASREDWFSGDDVFQLSKEEAGIIADRIILSVKEIDGNNLNFADEAKLRSGIQEIFYNWFVNYESLKELSDLSEYRTRLEEVQRIGEGYVGAGNMPDMDALLGACSGECNHKGCEGSSCKIGSVAGSLVPVNEVFTSSPGFQLVEFDVEGMTCTGCETHLMSELIKLTGVDQVDASFKEGIAKISFDESEISTDALVDAINATGYKVVEK